VAPRRGPFWRVIEGVEDVSDAERRWMKDAGGAEGLDDVDGAAGANDVGRDAGQDDSVVCAG